MVHSRQTARLIVAGLGVSLTAGSAWSYKIVLPGIHESITRAAQACVRDAEGALPTYCGDRHSAIARDAYLDPGQGYSATEKAVRWPDDPTRAIGSLGSGKYVSQLLVECPRITRATSRLDEVGLTCSSHFGRLQFMHAQASRNPDGTAESNDTTRRKMLAWARFAYRIAVEDERLPLDADYCEAVGPLDDIGRDLAPEGLLQCREGEKKAWRVASLFNIKCSNLVSWGSCWHRWGSKPDRRAIRFAEGAILHMVQDSFSQSHVYRGTGEAPDPKHSFKSAVVCAPARYYYEYNSQAGGHHSDADLLPDRDSSCRPGAAIDDVITASAKIIWHIDQKTPEDEFIQYLEKKVLG